MANLLTFNSGLGRDKKNGLLGQIQIIPMRNTLNNIATVSSNRPSVLNSSTNRATINRSTLTNNSFNNDNSFVRQQQEAQRRQQEEQQRQQRIAQMQREQEQRKQQEAQKRLEQQQANQQKQNDLLKSLRSQNLSSRNLLNATLGSTDIREAQAYQRLMKENAEQQRQAKKAADEAANPWKKYYDEEKQKVRDEAFKQDWGGSTLQDIFNAGWDRRLAENRARQRYASEILDKAMDKDGNVINQRYADLAKQVTAENVNVARAYADQEHARGKAIGATADSDYKDNRFYATLNAIRGMDVGNAIMQGAEGGAADAGRFLFNLLPGMFTAPIQGGGNIAETITGKGLDSKTGEHRDLTGLERMGRGVSGAIDAAGVFFGGTGDLLNEVGSALFKKGAKEVVKQTSKSVIKDYLKAMIEEGAEEGVQQAFEFFGDGGRLTTADGEFDADSFKQLLAETGQAAGLGAIGGGIFHGGARAVGALKSNLNNRLVANNVQTNTNLNTNVNENNNIVQDAETNTNETIEEPTIENVNIDTNTELDLNKIKTAVDGSYVKTNADGTTSKLSDAEFADVLWLKKNINFMDEVSGTNPFIDNSFDIKSGDEDIATLTKRAEQGDSYAKQKLAEMLQEGLTNNKEGWRGKSVDEVINPENENAPEIKAELNNTLAQDQAQESNLNKRNLDREPTIPTEEATQRAQAMANVLEEMPEDWKITEGATTAPLGYVWVDNGKSMFSGDRQTALVPESAIYGRNKTVAEAISNQPEIQTPSELDQSPEVLDSERAIRDEQSEADRQELLEELNSLWGISEETTAPKVETYNAELSSQKAQDVMDGKTSFDDYLGDQRELLWKSFKDSNRGTETFYHRDENGHIDGRNTVSENGALYRQLYKEVGAKPNKSEFNEALNDVLAKGQDSRYYDGFKELDPDGDTALYDFNKGSEYIDNILKLKEATREVSAGTNPIATAEDGTPEFVKRYTSVTELAGEDNSMPTRQTRVSQFMDTLKNSDNAIAKKFYDLWSGKRKKSILAGLTAEEAKRYASEGNVPIANDAKFVATDNFIRHEDNDGHFTGIKRYAEKLTGYQIDANPLTKSDISMLDDILKNPDTIKNVGNGRDGVKLKIEKQINDRFRVIAEVVNDGKELNIVSLYKQNKNPLGGFLPTSGNSGVSEVNGEVRTESPRSETVNSADSIAQTSEKVKSESSRSYESETESLPEDFDVKHYVTEQVEAQQKRSKVPIKERIADTVAELKHYLVDDAVAYERYIKDKNERLDIREGVDRVRSSDLIASQYMRDHGLQEIGKMSDADLAEFQQYLIAKRALEVSEQGKATGRNKAADQALIESVGDKYAKEEQIIRDYTRAMLQYSADNGLISQKLADKLIEENPNYVPMNRVFDVLEKKTGFKSKQLANLNSQSVVQKMTGSERVVENPIESLMTNTMRMINEVERNKTAKLIAGSEAFHEKVLADGEKPRKGYDKLSYMVDGETVSYEVPELVAKEMKNLNNVLPKAADNILKVVGAPTRWLRSGATQNNPIFAVSNLMRDQMQTLVTGKVSANLKGTKDAVIATFSPTKHGKELRAELNRAGIIGNEYRQTYGYKPGEMIEQLQNSSKLGKQAVDKIKHPINALGDLIGRTEYFTRAQQYFGTDGDATTKAQAARNNTLNFGRAGATTRILNRIIPFLNAGIQGGRITVNSFKERPVHTTLAIASLAGVALAAKGAAEAQDKELWDRIDESDKGQNIIIFTKDAHYNSETNRVEGIVKIPVAQMIYPMMDAVNNLKGDAGDIATLAGDIFTAVTGLEAPNEEEGILPVINQLTPTAVKPFLETAMNKSTYTGSEIVSEYDSNKNPEDKGAKYTTGLARTIAKATGIDAPVVDNFIQNWGGGLAKDLSKVLTDNPDNKSDGGGIGAMFENGFNRRFLSGTVESQYEIAEGLAKNYKNEVKNSEEFKSLTPAEQQKILNAIDSDMNSIASMAAKVEQGRNEEIADKTLSKRQTEIVNNGFDASSYISSVVNKDTAYSGNGGGDMKTLEGDLSAYSNTSKRNNAIKTNDSISDSSKSIIERYNSMSSDDWNDYLYGNNAESAAAEYELARAKYENDLANGDLNDAQIIRREKELAKLEVSQKWTKEYRDAYSLAGTKADMQAYLNGLGAEERAHTVAVLNGLNNAMYEAGIITASTYKTRANAINNTTSKSGSSKSSTSSKYKTTDGQDKMTSAEASALSALAKTMVKNTNGDSAKAKTETPTTKRKMTKSKSSGSKSGLATYTPSGKKSVSVSKGANRSIA